MIFKILKEAIQDTLFRLKPPRAIEIQGFQMWINPRDSSYNIRKAFRAYLKYRIHEPATTELFKRIVKQGDVVVDIGANLGYFSLLASELGARVYAIEPEPRNFAYLKKNVELNGKEYGGDNFSVSVPPSTIFPKQIAISNKTGSFKLFLCPYDCGHHTLNQYDGIKDYRPESIWHFNKKYVEVTTFPLDEYIKERVNVIKMDIEGSEALALEGMDRILRENQDIKLFVEFFPLLLKDMGSSPKDFIEKLLSYKFKIDIIPDDYDAGKGIEVDSYEELMKYCPEENNHLNLFLYR